jgi:hypothetical protein
MDYPTRAGGLGWGTAPVWSALALIMIGLVAILARRESRDADTAIDHGDQLIDHTAHPQFDLALD